MDPDDIASRTTSALLASYAGILTELRRRKVVRSGNAPAGDYAELLVATALGGVLVDNSVKGHDVVLPDDTTVQVKARLVTAQPLSGQLQTSAIRSWSFGKLALVQLFADDYSVLRGVLLPQAAAKALSTHRAYVNSDVLMMTAAVLDHSEAEDITESLKAAAAEVGAKTGSTTGL